MKFSAFLSSGLTLLIASSASAQSDSNSPSRPRTNNLMNSTELTDTTADLMLCLGEDAMTSCIKRDGGGCEGNDLGCICRNFGKIMEVCFAENKLTADKTKCGDDILKRRDEFKKQVVSNCRRLKLDIDKSAFPNFDDGSASLNFGLGLLATAITGAAYTLA